MTQSEPESATCDSCGIDGVALRFGSIHDGNRLIPRGQTDEIHCIDQLYPPNYGECGFAELENNQTVKQEQTDPESGETVVRELRLAYENEHAKDRLKKRYNHPPDLPVAKDGWGRVDHDTSLPDTYLDGLYYFET